MCGFSYCAKSTVPGRRSLCLKRDSPERPSLPHLIQSICSSSSCPFYHLLLLQDSNVPHLLLWPGHLNPLTSPGRKAKQKWWSLENSLYFPFSTSLFPSPHLSTALLRQDSLSFLVFRDKPSSPSVDPLGWVPFKMYPAASLVLDPHTPWPFL